MNEELVQQQLWLSTVVVQQLRLFHKSFQWSVPQDAIEPCQCCSSRSAEESQVPSALPENTLPKVSFDFGENVPFNCAHDVHLQLSI